MHAGTLFFPRLANVIKTLSHTSYNYDPLQTRVLRRRRILGGRRGIRLLLARAAGVTEDL